MLAVAHSWKEVPAELQIQAVACHMTSPSLLVSRCHTSPSLSTHHICTITTKDSTSCDFSSTTKPSHYIQWSSLSTKHLAKKKRKNVTDNFSLKKLHNAKLVPLIVVSFGSKSFLHSILSHFKHCSETFSWTLFSCYFIFLYVLHVTKLESFLKMF